MRLLLAFLVFLGSCAGDTATTPLTVGSITIFVGTTSLQYGQTVQLSASVTSTTGVSLKGRTVTWSSSNDAIAAVSSAGLVTAGAVRGGTAESVTITATSEGKSASAVITIAPIPVASVSPSLAQVAFYVGQTVQLSITAKDVTGSAVTGRAVTWTSTSAAIASVSPQGQVTALAPGTASIIGTVEGKTATVSVTVALVPVSTVTVTPAAASLYVGQTLQLSASARDSAGNLLTGRIVTWSSNSPSVVSISNQGAITGVSAGTSTITAQIDGRSASLSIAVRFQYQLSIRQGNFQSSRILAAVTIQPEVQVTDTLGNSIAGKPVIFAVTSGGGTVANTNVSTSASGFASAGQWTLGPESGIQKLAVYTQGSDSIVFTATATGAIVPVEAKSFSAGPFHSCALLNSGGVSCWGSNYSGELGDGSRDQSLKPVNSSSSSPFVAITSSGASEWKPFNCALTQSGDVHCWGNNDSGTFGNGTTTSSLRPIVTIAGQNFRSISAGARHICGLDMNGRAFCWGSNGHGQLGDGTYTQRIVPTPVSGGFTFLSISAGYVHTCAVTQDKQILCWGANEGALGDGTRTGRLFPTRVNSNESFSQVTAGGLHSCGLTVSGDAWCWGTNQDGAQGVTDGQLGDGTRTERISPVKVQTTLKFSSLFASNNLTCGISSGTAYCWGRGGHGALGNGSTKDQLVPTKVATSVGFKQLTGGPTFTCGLSADSSSVIYCWGSNSLGQLGNWTTLSTLTPQKAIWRIDP